MLRLVHPAPPDQALIRPKRSGSKPAALYLTAEEQRHVRAALQNAIRAHGSFNALALALGMPRETLYGLSARRRSIQGTFAIRLAKVAGVSVESILTGAITEVNTCPTCGHRPGAGRLVPPEGGAR